MNKLTKNILCLGSLALAATLYSCDPDTPTPTPEPEPGPITENAIEWCGNINEATTWSNHSEGVDYIVTCEVAINDNFIIEPGTEIVFEGNASGLLVNTGVLIAKGTAAEPIYFRGKNGLAGDWKGIKIISKEPGIELTYCVISGGGGSGFLAGVGAEPSNLVVSDLANDVKVENCTFVKSGGYGVYVAGGVINSPTPFSSFTNNTFTENDLNPISVLAATVGQIGGLDHTFTDNGEQMIEVRSSRVKQNMVWDASEVPYHILGNVLMYGGNLTVSAGVEMQFDPGIGLYADYDYNNYIKMMGTADNPIRMISFDPADYWDGIYTNTRSVQSEMNYVILDRAGSSKMQFPGDAAAAGAVNVGGDSNTELKLTLNHCTITNSLGYGVTGYNLPSYGLVFPTLNDMTYEGNVLDDTYLDM